MRVSLFGYGKTTQALAQEFSHVDFYDDKCHKPFKDANGYRVSPASFFDPLYSDLEIPSPGIPPIHPLIQKARHLQSEYDYFADVMPRSIWVSGTNGKTTTTQMITHLLGEEIAQAGGNIGTPLASMDRAKPLWILETSSFTLHYTHIAKPDIYVLLPIREDHISWHGSFEAYEAAKLKPLEMMQEGEIAIVPKKYASLRSSAALIGYERSEDLASYFGIDPNKIAYKGAFLLDALLAMAIDKILFDRVDYDKINAFRLDANRQEKLYDGSQRVWINDTKATNIDATIACVENFKDRTIHLILGGDDKGVELEPLFRYLQDKDITTYHIGANTKRLDAYAKHYGIAFVSCENLEDAIKEIDKHHTKKTVAILSPAAASLDQFSSYAHRGEVFKEAIRRL